MTLPLYRIDKRATFAENLRAYAAAFLTDDIEVSPDGKPNLPTEEDLAGIPFPEYAFRPVAFCRDVLGVKVTADVKRLMQTFSGVRTTIALSANAVGKTHAAACLVVWGYKTRRQIQIYLSAAPPEENLKDLLWGEIGAIVERHPWLFAEDRVSIPGMLIKRNAKTFIRGVAIPNSGSEKGREARFSGKHAEHIWFVFDEGDAIPGAVYKGAESCMSGGEAKLLVMLNPRDDTGTVAQMAKRDQGAVVPISALTHPNVFSGKNLIPGAVTRETTVRRIQEWTRALAPGEPVDKTTCFRVPLCLEGATAYRDNGEMYPPLTAGWRKIEEPDFYYMVLGRYPPMAVNQLISRDWIEAAFGRWQFHVSKHGERPPEGVRSICGLDPAELGDDTSVYTARYGSWVARQQQWSGVDIPETERRSRDLYGRFNAAYLNVDSTGIGAGIAPHLREKKMDARRIMVQSAPDLEDLPPRILEAGRFYHVRDLMAWLCREWLRSDPTAALPPDEELADELAAWTYSKDGPKGEIRLCATSVVKEKIRRSPDKASSLFLTFAPGPKPKDRAKKRSYISGGSLSRRLFSGGKPAG